MADSDFQDPQIGLNMGRALDSTSLVWSVARLASKDATPSEWMSAEVPGAVQLDWARAQKLPDPHYGNNCLLYQGLEDSFWLYRCEIPRISLENGGRLVLKGDGLDYHADIRLVGEPWHSHTGICTPFELDVTAAAASGGQVDILLHPAPKIPGATGRAQAANVTKPAVSYGWDWHPELIALGLCHDIRLEARPKAYVRHADFDYKLAEDFQSVRIQVSVETSEPAPFRWTLKDPDGNLVLTGSGAEAELSAPRLWWTHDHGSPELYELRVELDAEGCNAITRHVGFRRVRLVMHEGAWEYPPGFPKSRSLPPITVELNGRRIFARGSSWVNPDIFHGKVGQDTYQPLLKLAKEAHFNLLRCWGGAPAAKESFFTECDRLGLLVWQEFPLSCNAYPDTWEYLADLDRESRAIIRRVRQHPCLALWCGGNELFNSWSGMNDQSLALRLLNRNCFDLDPATPFLPTAPVEGMGHGDYRFRDPNGRETFRIFQESTNTAYSEFGCPGVSPVEALKKFIPSEELWPPKSGTSWQTHHAFHAWSPDEEYWINLKAIRHYFGEPESLEELVARGEWLQCEGFKGAFEEARRQWPRCSMALSWCYNEAWPTAAGNSLIHYPASPKPAYHAVKEACRPTLASARIPKFQWELGEFFSAELWILNDCPDSQNGGDLVASFEWGTGAKELLRWPIGEVSPQFNLAGPSVRARIPEGAEGEFFLCLTVTGNPEWTSRYRLSVKEMEVLPNRPVPATPDLNM